MGEANFKGDLPTPEVQVAFQVLDGIKPLVNRLEFIRGKGINIEISSEIEALYVEKHGRDGQRLIDQLLGREQSIASVNVKIFMRLEDSQSQTRERI